jgi:hypothetical protein
MTSTSSLAPLLFARDITRLVLSLGCQFLSVRSATIIPTEWIELTGRGRDCTIMMKACLPVALHFLLEMQMFVVHFSIYVVVLNVLARSTHVLFFCAATKQSVRLLCKDALHRCWKDTSGGGDLGQSARNRASYRDCGFSARLVPSCFLVLPNPTMLVSRRSRFRHGVCYLQHRWK